MSCDSCVVAHKTARYDLGAKIFGVGFKKTGTTSLAAALRRLKIGPEPDHRAAVAATVALLGSGADAAPAVRAAAAARAFADAPWCMAATRGDLLEKLSTAYPRAKFVLTVRPAADWWRSVRNWLACLKPFNKDRYVAMLGATAFDETAMVAAYERYNARVRDHFAATPDRLLELDFSAGGADDFPWEKLCAFVEAWGRCPKGAALRANAFVRRADVASMIAATPRNAVETSPPGDSVETSRDREVRRAP